MLQVREERFEQLGHLGGGLEPLGRVLGVEPRDDRRQPGGDVGVELADRPGSSSQTRRRTAMVVAERRAAGAHGVQHAAEAEQVGAVVDRLACACSGAMYCGVPATTPLCVRLASSTARARPKSVILTRSTPFSSRMFEGLMSRCTSPWACAAARPAAVCMPIRKISLAPSGPVVDPLLERRPGTNCITR